MMSRLRFDDTKQIIFYAAWKNIASEDLRSRGFINALQEDLIANNLTLKDLRNYIWIFDLKPEGINANDMAQFYNFLCKEQHVPDKNFRVAFSCVEDVERLPYPAVCLPDGLIRNGNWFETMEHYKINWANLEMTHKLVCLMRRPSISRAMLAKRLYSKFDPTELILTFGTNGSDTSDEIRRIIQPHPYPIIVDKPVVDQVFQHRIDHDKFYHAPVNLVVESSSQTDPNVWRSIFITEKTHKAFAWHQFPIWYAVPGLVNEVRKLGFDMFDDVFDNHSYDNIEDPWQRMTQVVLLAKKVCQDANQLRVKHWNRLESNAEIVKEIHTLAVSRHEETMNRLINYE